MHLHLLTCSYYLLSTFKNGTEISKQKLFVMIIIIVAIIFSLRQKCCVLVSTTLALMRAREIAEVCIFLPLTRPRGPPHPQPRILIFQYNFF